MPSPGSQEPPTLPQNTQSTSRFAPYKRALHDLSLRTRTPLPSLILSFGILHELTAIAPLVGVFFVSKRLGLGEGIVDKLTGTAVLADEANRSWIKERMRGWVDEGEAWTGRLGKRYGLFGFQKESASGVKEGEGRLLLAGDVANAVVAYTVTKAILPLRIGVSLYLSPAFSRRIIQPLYSISVRAFRRNSR